MGRKTFFLYGWNRNERYRLEETIQHIGYVNVIISYVKEFEKDPEEIRRRVMGEAQFLRGWYYYMLVNLYAKPYLRKRRVWIWEFL